MDDVVKSGLLTRSAWFYPPLLSFYSCCISEHCFRIKCTIFILAKCGARGSILKSGSLCF